MEKRNASKTIPYTPKPSIFAVYKPVGITSHDVVAKIRKLTGVKRVGHGGTLDPLAEGVLVIAVGRENTKKLETYVQGEKEYIAEIKLGEVSETDDREGPITKYMGKVSSVKNEAVIPLKKGIQKTLTTEKTIELETKQYEDTDPKKLSPSPYPLYPSRSDIESTIQNFIGKFPQMPPKYSAKKIGGKTAYRLARAGKDIKLEPKIVEIMQIEIIRYQYPFLSIRVRCGSGVYIRSLARDIGERLGTGAYLAGLQRTKVGHFTADESLPFENLENTFSQYPS